MFSHSRDEHLIKTDVKPRKETGLQTTYSIDHAGLSTMGNSGKSESLRGLISDLLMINNNILEEAISPNDPGYN